MNSWVKASHPLGNPGQNISKCYCFIKYNRLAIIYNKELASSYYTFHILTPKVNF